MLVAISLMAPVSAQASYIPLDESKQRNDDARLRGKVAGAIAVRSSNRLTGIALAEHLAKIAELTRLIDLSPGESRRYLERAAEYVANGDFARAQKDLVSEERLLFNHYWRQSKQSYCEPYSFAYNDDPLPADFDYTFCIFKNGPNGEKSRAYKDYLQRERDKIEKILNTPIYQGLSIQYAGSSGMAGMPGYKLWTYKIIGLEKNPELRKFTLRVDTRYGDLKLAVPENCVVDASESTQVKRFDGRLVENMSGADSLSKSVRIEGKQVYFNADVFRDPSATTVSFVSGCKPGTGLYDIEMVIPGYQSVFASLPLPAND